MASDSKEAIVVVGRSHNGAYYVLSLYERSNGVRVTVVEESDAAADPQELLVSWDEVISRVGAVGPSMPKEKRVPLYEKFLSGGYIALQPKGDGSGAVKPELTSDRSGGSGGGGGGDAGGGGGDAGGKKPEEPSKVVATRTEGRVQSPGPGPSPFDITGRPPASPITTASKGPSHTPIKKRPKTEAGRMRGSKSTNDLSKTMPHPSKRGGTASSAALPRGSPTRHSATGGSRPKTSGPKPVAGYKPPTDLSVLDDTVLEKAHELCADNEGMHAFVKRPAVKLAAKRVGVTMDDLLPRTKASFRTSPAVTNAQVNVRYRHFENRRVENLALVLTELPIAEGTMRELRRKKQAQMMTLSDGFLDTLERERRRLTHIASSREKLQSVSIRENELLRKRRADFEVHLQEMEAKQDRVRSQKERERAAVKARSMQRAQEIALVQSMRDKREQDRIDSIREAARIREEKLAEKKAREDEAKRKRNEEIHRREALRERKREEAQEQLQARREMMLNELKDKAGMREMIKAKLDAEISTQREKRWMIAQTRIENAQRVRREREFRQKAVMERIKLVYEKMEHMKEMRLAVEEERRQKRREEIIRQDKWKDSTKFERACTPGPGEYDTGNVSWAKAGGSWGRYNSKSDLEWIILRAKAIPGPGQYRRRRNSALKGGLINKYNPKSDLEWQLYRAKQTPGVGDYEPKAVAPGFTVTFGNFKSKTDIEKTIERAKGIPGPADYASKDIIPPKSKPTIKALREKFATARKKLRNASIFISGAKAAAAMRRASQQEIADAIEKIRAEHEEGTI